MPLNIFTHSNEDLLIGLQRLARQLRRSPTRREIDRSSLCPSTWVYYARFGSLRAAFAAAGLPYSRITKAEALSKSRVR
jgi:hypothetical protein